MIAGRTYQRNEEFDWSDWPACKSGAVVPINEAAKRIVHQYKKPDHSPASTWNSDHSRHFVPHYLPSDFMHGRKPPLPDTEFPSMPKFRAVWPGYYGGREVTEGEIIAWCGWPNQELEPVNDAAREVVEYFDRYRDHPKLLPSPFCDLTCEVFLPELMTDVEKEIASRRAASRARSSPTSSIDRIQTPLLNEPKRQPRPVIAAKTHIGGARRRVA
jgi:hypothetical protein